MKRSLLTQTLVGGVVIALLAACGAPETELPTLAPTQPQATQLPPTAPPPSPTAVPPTETSAPAATPTLAASPTSTSAPTIAPAENPIAHLSVGTPLTITAIHMNDAQSGWATGGAVNIGDHVFRTSDGGNTWKDVTPPEPAPPPDSPIRAVGYFMDANTAWVAYN